jgi:hypothetical protein
MSQLDRTKWVELKAELEAGRREGIVALKRGAMVVKKRAGELTEEEKRQYKLLGLKIKMHNRISDLGARVYSLVATAGEINPAHDATVKDIIAQVKRYEAEIANLENAPRKSTKQRIKKAA